MTQPSALPFTLRRSDTSYGKEGEFVTTTEHVVGLLRLDTDRLVVQWRRSRSTQLVGMEMRTDRDVEQVREVVIPLAALAGAAVRWIWWRWPPGLHLVLTGADLVAFEEIAGESGLRLDHPAELVLRIRRTDGHAARMFAGELELAVADLALRDAERPLLDAEHGRPRLGPADSG
jgi:hypothetical protein